MNWKNILKVVVAAVGTGAASYAGAAASQQLQGAGKVTNWSSVGGAAIGGALAGAIALLTHSPLQSTPAPADSDFTKQ